MRSILVLRCITQSATPGTNHAGTSTYMRYLTVTDSTSDGSAETLSTGVSRQARRASRKRIVPGYLEAADRNRLSQLTGVARLP